MGPAGGAGWGADALLVVHPKGEWHEKGGISTPNRVVIVLPEVFGVNAWVRSVADRLAADGIPALAIPLFSRTAPDLDLGYSDADLALGRSHKEATTSDQILSDVAAAITWLGEQHPQASIGVVGFCFGGHAALLAATLAEVEVSVDFYGAGVSRMCPGGAPPSLTRLPQVQGPIALCGTADPRYHRDQLRSRPRSNKPIQAANGRIRH